MVCTTLYTVVHAAEGVDHICHTIHKVLLYVKYQKRQKRKIDMTEDEVKKVKNYTFTHKTNGMEII